MSEEPDIYEKQLRDNGVRSIETYDKNLILVSSGGLVLSMTFIEKLTASPPQYPLLLVATWCLLGLTLIASLFSHFISAEAHRYLLKGYRELNQECSDEEWLIAIAPLNKVVDRTNSWVVGLNYTSLCLFVTGVITLIFFASANVLTPKPIIDVQRKATTEATGDSTSRASTRDKRHPIRSFTKDSTVTTKTKEVTKGRP